MDALKVGDSVVLENREAGVHLAIDGRGCGADYEAFITHMLTNPGTIVAIDGTIYAAISAYNGKLRKARGYRVRWEKVPTAMPGYVGNWL